MHEMTITLTFKVHAWSLHVDLNMKLNGFMYCALQSFTGIAFSLSVRRY